MFKFLTKKVSSENGEPESARPKVAKNEDENSDELIERVEGVPEEDGRISGDGESEGHSFRVDRDLFQEIVSGARRMAERSQRLSVYHSGVFRCESDPINHTRVKNIIERGKNSWFKFLIKHGDHFHVIHDCLFSNGQCRCFGVILERRTTSKTSINELSEGDWRNIFDYHLASGRYLHYGKIGEAYQWNVPLGYEIIRPQEDSSGTYWDKGNVEICRNEHQILWQPGDGLRDIQLESDVGESSSEVYRTAEQSQTKGRGRKRQFANQEAEEIQQKLEEICASPITDGDRSKYWIFSDFKYLTDYRLAVKLAKNVLKVKISNFCLKDFELFYINKNPIWSSYSLESFSDYYFDLDTSIYKAVQLLIYQFCPQYLNEEFEIMDTDLYKPFICNYLRNLFSLIDKKSGKVNSHYYISPPCSGKTFFFDAFRDYFLNTGNMSNFNRNSQFPLQMCVDVRIIFWNEPNAEPAAMEDLKKILGGEFYSANRKNRDHCEIKRTPVIITANNRILPDNDAFRSRVIYYEWKTAPFLKDNKNKRLHPFTVKKLVELTENFYEEFL